MKRTYISDIKDSTDESILVKGWIHKIYELTTISFVQLRDKTGIIQLVVDKKTAKKLRLEMCIEAIGEKAENEKSPSGFELQVKELKIIGDVYYEKLPFEINSYKQKTALEKQLDFRGLSLRAPKQRAIFKVQQEITDALRTYLKERHFSEIHTPKLISSSTEGGSEMFTVDYFGRRAFLAQSPQFYKQMMVGAGFERVFEIAPAYRAELHGTWRHLSEYISLDIEMGFIKDETDLMDLEEGFINYLYSHLKKTCPQELEMFNSDLPDKVEIPRIPLAKAHEILLEKYNKKSPIGNIDAEGEELICKYVKEKYDCDYVFLTEYPISKRPMYAMPDSEKPGLTKSFDLIFKGLEITTGGQRIHNYEMLKENIKKFGLNPDDFSFYLETFKYGMPPHGGLAIGLERITMKILNLENIRQSTLLPRDLKRLEP
ncbi:MAG: aspartate--tRNA(Asn) ligase [Clostridiaceae bacterium]|nr:aspartate--tRNA(Asn) ligase [Clostridiaceae bacterium]